MFSLMNMKAILWNTGSNIYCKHTNTFTVQEVGIEYVYVGTTTLI